MEGGRYIGWIGRGIEKRGWERASEIREKEL